MKTTMLGLAFCATLGLSGSALAETTTWSANASGLAGQVGKVFTWTCPANGAAGGTVYGSGPYTTDSPVCPAAVHAGKISFDKGGSVTFQIRGGSPSYEASTRHGIATHAWGSYGSSFTFDVGSAELSWSDNASAHAGSTGQAFTFTCPANGALGTAIYGSDSYTTDSSICVAAVHAGKITPDKGGAVTIVIKGGMPSYASTTRHGVKSNAWGSYGSTYTFK
jgi:hypothetical protein